MPMNVRHFALIGLLTTAGVMPAGADNPSLRWLADGEIAAALKGKTIEGRYASGRAFTERYDLGGRVKYEEDGATIGGRWSITSGTLCTIYDNDPAGGCFRVARVSENCFEFYFAARTEAATPGPKGSAPLWTARGAVDGQTAACADGASV